MRRGLALLAGIVGGVATVLIVSAVSWITGTGGVDMAAFLGAILTGETTVPAWILGFALSLLLSGLIGLVYAAGFDLAGKASWRLGLIGGLLHAAVAGFALLILPAIHPAMPETLQAPGAFGANYGPIAAGAFIAARLAYGAIVGAIYRPANVPVTPPVDLESGPEDHTIGAGEHGTRWH